MRNTRLDNNCHTQHRHGCAGAVGTTLNQQYTLYPKRVSSPALTLAKQQHYQSTVWFFTLGTSSPGQATQHSIRQFPDRRQSLRPSGFACAHCIRRSRGTDSTRKLPWAKTEQRRRPQRCRGRRRTRRVAHGGKATASPPAVAIAGEAGHAAAVSRRHLAVTAVRCFRRCMGGMPGRYGCSRQMR